MENQIKYHGFTPLSKQQFQKVRDILQKVHEDKMTEEEALKLITKSDIANYSLMCQHSDYKL